MPLTYQPFEYVPALNEIGKSLRKNVSPEERGISGLVGLMLIGASYTRGQGLLKTMLFGTGVALIGRGWTGHCPLYEELEVRRARRQNYPDQEKAD